ncbi:kinase [Enterovibrio norvegicus]|uniref:PfkB family carbohydrate kinase n=1 Tax=Enterovibrio norvegicus TaxID=188144 RepID=UPI0002EE8379|nr:PfkB family carbohydrate kinase [Enterovibrio norvegicus]OEF64204.1 kinase [Enterovibrio norvegicus]
MTSREDEILQLIKGDPFIQQQAIADLLNISRSAVAVHIMNMTKKGIIQGKGYFIANQQYVVVIGGMNMDILGQPDNAFIERDSNPGKVKGSAGGVGRNIAENLARLGTDVRLISVVGDDAYGDLILNQTKMAGVDINAVNQISNQTTSTYLSLLDNQGDMVAAVSDMSILKHLNVSLLSQYVELIRNASAVIVDTNLSDTTLAYIFSKFSDKNIYLDAVSSAKASKAKPYLSRVHTLKPNLIEAQAISGLPLESELDIDNIADWFIQHGVQRLFLTMGADGVLYRTQNNEQLVRPLPVKVVNANGAGDAFLAGIVHGQLAGLSDIEACHFASGCAAIALEHTNTINPNINELLVQQRIEDVPC